MIRNQQEDRRPFQVVETANMKDLREEKKNESKAWSWKKMGIGAGRRN